MNMLKHTLVGGFACAVILGGLVGCGKGPKPEDAIAPVEAPPPFQMAPLAMSGWRRISTVDGLVSVAFPDEELREETMGDGAGGMPQMFTLSYNATNKGINLRLSVNKMPPESLAWRGDQHVTQITKSLTENHFDVMMVGDFPGVTNAYQIVAEKEGGALRFVIRVAIRNGTIYRAIATSPKEFNEDPLVVTFMNSFQCQPAGATGGQ